MRYSIAPVALAALAAANPVPQGVTEAIPPSTQAPAGCEASRSGTFNIQVVNVTSSMKVKRQNGPKSGVLTLTLQDGILKDQAGRTGYIAANNQFQFDAPAQTGAIYTAGWSLCQNNTLALGSQVVFQQCLSGDFYNLYDKNTSPQCTPIYIEAINGGGSATQQMGDGQPVQQIGDGQPQAVSQIPDGQIQVMTGSPVTQLADGQPQAPTGAPVTQINDGQIQAPTTTGAPVTQINDGQIQAPKQTGSPVTQIADGQIQAPTGSPVTQIADGQIQAPANATASAPAQYTGAAAIPTMRSELFGLAAGVLAVAMF